MSIRVLLVDDQPLIRLGFAAILDSTEDIEVVGEAGDGQQALDAAAELAPDVICMDVQMPTMDGITATRRITASDSTAAVLILTTFDRDDFLFETLDAGASGFLLKSAGPEELIEAVRVLGRGDALLDPQVTRRVISRTVTGAEAEDAPASSTPGSTPTGAGPGAGAGSAVEPEVAVHGETVQEDAEALDAAGLTAREAEILRLMARGLSNGEIAAELVVGESTVKTHVSNVLMKLGARDRVRAVIWAFEHGVATV